MYDIEPRNEFDPSAVTWHRGDRHAFYRRLLCQTVIASRAGGDARRQLSDHLVNWIADDRTLRLAWDQLAAKGGRAPGPNGRRYSDHSHLEVWNLCRCLAGSIRRAKYRPGPERVVSVPKSKGGTRPIVLSNIHDRVVQRAIHLVLQPVLEPLFDPCSLGYRPHRGVNHALALAESLSLSQHRFFWVVEDVRDAFLNVPIPRLLQIVAKYLPSQALINLLATVLPSQRLPGMRQGGPLSPLMMNLYLHHVFDGPWRKRYPNIPFIRVADDLLVLCNSEEEARDAYAAVEGLMSPAGLPLKGSATSAVHDLNSSSVDWLGTSISKCGDGLEFRIHEKAWRRLDERMALAHSKPNSPAWASQCLRCWLQQRGPCYSASDKQNCLVRIRQTAARHAFEEIPEPRELRQLWQAAHARWSRVRNATTTS